MSFSIRLAQDLTAVEAGATVPLSVEVTVKGEEPDRFEMQVEGLDPEWTASPEPVFTAAQGETQAQKVFFKPPRSSESLAGNYPFVVRVRSLNSGESKTVQGVLQIKAFNHLSMEIGPKKGFTSPMRPQAGFTITLINLGNTEHTLQLSGADPEEACTFDFESDQVTVGPGQQKEVEVVARAGRGGVVASSRLFGFSISARSIQNPSVIATAQAQLEQRPLVSPATLLTVFILIAVAAVWFAFRPQPPTITIAADDSNVIRGQAAHIRWRGTHASSVRLEILRNRDNKVVSTENVMDLPLDGSREILTTNEDTITVRAFAVADNRTQPATPVTILVQEPEKAPEPKITMFKAASSRIKLGESVLFSFKYSSDVTKLVLSPTNQEILPPADEIEVKPTHSGTIEYTLFAYNKENGVASRSVKVDAEQVSDAVIGDFSAHPAVLQAPEAQTIVTWSVSNAALVQLDDGSGSGPKTVDAVSTGLPVVTDHDVTLKLIATDAKGVTTSKRITIKVRAAPAPIQPGPGSPTNPVTTGGGGQ